MKSLAKWINIAVCTFLFSCIVGVILYLTIEDAFVAIFPLIVVPFPVLMYRLFQKNITISVKFLLATLVSLVVISAIDILLYYVYYVARYGDDVLHLILWKELVGFVCATSLLNMSVLIAIVSYKKHSNIVVCILYLLFTFITAILAIMLYGLISTLSVSILFVVITAILAFLIVSALCLFRSKKTIAYNTNQSEII